MATLARRLPGIRVDAAPPPAAEALPRMDVAVFVGFASTGPLHLPVVVESVRQYAAVFGPDAPLARDEGAGARVHAWLGPAVRAFFSNGGRRCWVVRVARTAASEALRAAAGAEPRPVAVANRFAVPGVLAVAAGAEAAPALAQARCEGSWSDGVRVSAALSRPAFALVPDAAVSPAAGRFGFRTRHGVRPGDLVEVEDPGGPCTWATVDVVRASAEPAGPYEVEATLRAAFEPVGAAVMGSPAADVVGRARVEGFGSEVDATLSLAGDGGFRVRFHDPMPAALEEGHWARWSGGGETVWLRMDEIERRPAFAGSPAEAEAGRVHATAAGPAWRALEPAAPTGPGALRAFLPTLELRVARGDGVARLNGVGLSPSHPAAWWSQRTDADFHLPPDPAGAEVPEPPADVERFPLARAEGDAPAAWIPLGVEPLYGPALSALPQAGTALERDGLAPFGADLFLDPELADATLHDLSALADDIRFLRAHTRPLLGMHAALSVGRGGLFNEGTLLAVPDAVHLGWTRRSGGEALPPSPGAGERPAHWGTHRGPCADPAAAPEGGPDFGVFLDCDTRLLPAPVLHGHDAPVPPGACRLWWEDPGPGGEYVLVEAAQADFSDAREVYRGAQPEFVALEQREGVFYYQVHVEVGDERSAGSNAVAVRVRADEWVQQDPAAAGEALEAEWLAVHRAALRMAAAGGDLFAALAMPRHFRTQQALRYAARLRAVNRPPAGAEPGAFGFTEARAPSYGALYFPWLHADARLAAPPLPGADGLAPTVRPGSLAAGPPVAVPPDGAALGVLARRAGERGAWVAPANQPLRDVVALVPAVPAADRLALQEAQVNLVRGDPRGFLALSADTLALDGALRPINVRRLLILLRRAALRRGHSYVFEPHGPVLRRAVERGFEALLGDLFRRGAFAGATPAQAYRVVADDTVNPGQDVEAGRMVVELRVAPSVPLSFIAVRLEQSGARFTVTEEL